MPPRISHACIAWASLLRPLMTVAWACSVHRRPAKSPLVRTPIATSMPDLLQQKSFPAATSQITEVARSTATPTAIETPTWMATLAPRCGNRYSGSGGEPQAPPFIRSFQPNLIPKEVEYYHRAWTPFYRQDSPRLLVLSLECLRQHRGYYQNKQRQSVQMAASFTLSDFHARYSSAGQPPHPRFEADSVLPIPYYIKGYICGRD
jgi:hypothetical protein